MLTGGTLLAPSQVVDELCGPRSCRSTHCTRLCNQLRQKHSNIDDETKTLMMELIIEHGLDPGEAAALALAISIKNNSPNARIVILTGDGKARETINNYLNEEGLEAHGDLYVIELAKKLGYCSPAEAAELAETLPRLGRYINGYIAHRAARRLRNQQIGTRRPMT